MHELNEPGPSVERTVQLDADADQVWQQITRGPALSDWMGGPVTIDPRPGGRITLEEAGRPEVWGTVEEVVEQERIQWTWRTDTGLPTQVELEVEAGFDHTRLTVRETLLPWTVSGPDGTNLSPLTILLGSSMLGKAA